jgi:hypothetical protein
MSRLTFGYGFTLAVGCRTASELFSFGQCVFALPSNEDEGAPFIVLLILLALWNARLDLVF